MFASARKLSPPPSRASLLKTKAPETKPRVLLVEDDPDFRHFLASELAHSGLEVMQLTNGYEFADYVATLSLYPVRRPELIITDVRMPGFDGLTILSGMRTARWHTPVIVMTAFGDQSVIDEALDNQAVTVFSKPFDLNSFKQCVDETIRKGRDEKEKRSARRNMHAVP